MWGSREFDVHKSEITAVVMILLFQISEVILLQKIIAALQCEWTLDILNEWMSDPLCICYDPLLCCWQWTPDVCAIPDDSCYTKIIWMNACLSHCSICPINVQWGWGHVTVGKVHASQHSLVFSGFGFCKALRCVWVIITLQGVSLLRKMLIFEN